MFGQPVAGHDERIRVPIVVLVVRAVEDLARRVLALLVEPILEWRFLRLVVRRHRTVDEPRRREEPAQAVRVQDEGAASVERLHAGGAARGVVVGRLVRLEVRLVAEPGPLLLLLVPPDVLLALRPRLALWVGRCPVVEDASVAGPGPTPVRGDPVLLPVRPLARRLVDRMLVDPGMDPRAAGRGPVVAQLLVLLDVAAVLPVEAADLHQHDFSVRFVVRSERRVVPGQVEDRAVLRIARPRELVADLAPEVEEEVQLRTGVLPRLDRFVVPLEEPLRVRERAVLLGVRSGR